MLRLQIVKPVWGQDKQFIIQELQPATVQGNATKKIGLRWPLEAT
jgi:hypothetical protein